MRITIYLKDGTTIKDCLITSISKTHNGELLETTDFYNEKHTYNYDEIALVILKDV